MIAAKPIPINVRANKKLIAGSAFLVSGDSTVWLVTCVHNLTMMSETPVSALDPQSLITVLGTSVNIPVFNSRALGMIRRDGSSILYDCISIPLTTDEGNALNSFGAFNVADIFPATMNSSVTFTGFPGMTTQLEEMSSVQGCVSQVRGISIAVDKPALPGFSGGPLFTDTGLLGVMHGDIGEAPIYTNGLAISLHAVRSLLFQ